MSHTLLKNRTSGGSRHNVQAILHCNTSKTELLRPQQHHAFEEARHFQRVQAPARLLAAVVSPGRT